MLMAVLVFVSVRAEGAREDEVLHRLGRLDDQGVLKRHLEEQLRLSALAEEHRQLLLAQRQEVERASFLLEKEVILLEAEVAQQQQAVRGALLEAAAAVAQTHRRFVDDGIARLFSASHEADRAGLRLCEALTEGEGNLRLLCRGATRQPHPNLSLLLDRLERRLAGGRVYPRNSLLLPKVLLVLGVWAALGWLLIPSRKTLKNE